MKSKLIAIITVLLIVYSCEEKKPKTEVPEPLPKVIVKEVLITSQNCNPDSSNCTYAKIVYPEFTDSLKFPINNIIAQKVRTTALDYVREDAITGTLEHIAQSFIHDFESFKVDFPEYNFGWYFNVTVDIIYESADIISLSIYSESFTGGAHPNHGTMYYIIDKGKDKILKMTDIISDTTRFKILLEKEFRAKKGIDEHQSFADVGYYINDGDFLLNDNIGITEESILVHFNPYEIAPYSEGATTLELKKESLSGILKIK